jgi:hypothetical protein
MVARCAFCGSTSPLGDVDWLIRLPTCLGCRTDTTPPSVGAAFHDLQAGGFGVPWWREQAKHGGADERQAPGSRRRAAAAGLW